MLFTQVGNQLAMQVHQLGVVSAVGQGALMGNAMQMDYLNVAMMPGRMTGTVSADGSRIDMIDYGRGFPDPVTLTR